MEACARRRAVLSVMANPACKSQEEAERAVNEVWESCFKDTRPFDEVRCDSFTLGILIDLCVGE
jgi:inner membrane protease ATP23